MRTSTLGPVVTGLALALAISACSSSGTTKDNSTPAPSADSGSALSLKGSCPDKVVIQTDWNPESEYGNLYQLIGPGFTVDNKKKTVTGPLVASGRDTGVQVEVRVGGPAIGFQQVTAQMYQDKSITLGQITTDEAVQQSDKFPTLAVVSPMEISPIMLMWDPKQYPQFNTIADIGQTDVKVLYYETDTYAQYLLGAGILRPSQVDGGYEGTPDKWVASGGKIVQGGFATSEPYIYEKELPGKWNKPVDFRLVSDTNYPVYPQAISIRAEDKEKLSPCLKKLVPIIQQAQIDFMNDPGPTNTMVIDLVKGFRTGWTYSTGMADYAVKAMKDLGLISNGPNKTLGDFDLGRVQRIIDVDVPIFAAQKKPAKAGLKPEDLVTNEFIDPKIGLKTS
jgi:hypothetical protein